MRPLIVTFALLAVTSISSRSYADPLEDHLTAGAQAFGDENYELALAEFEQARKIEDNQVVRFNIARANEALGNCELARTQFEDLRDAELYDGDIARAVATRLDSTTGCAAKFVPKPVLSAPVAPTIVEPDVELEPPRTTAIAHDEVKVAAKPRTNVLAIVGWTTLGVGTAGLTAMLVEHVDNRARIREGGDRIAEPYGCSYSAATDTFDGSSCDSGAAASDPRYDDFRADVRTARSRNKVIFPITGGLMALGAAIVVYTALRGERAIAIVPWGGAGTAGASTIISF